MTAVAILTYYALAFSVIGGVACWTVRQSARRLRALNDEIIARMQEKYGNTPPLEPYVPLPLPEPPPPPELLVTIARHPESDPEQLPKLAAEMILAASRLEKEYGGDGLEYDPQGSVEEPGRLILRLVSRSSDWDSADRLAAVAEELNRLTEQAKNGESVRQAADIRAKIDRELRPHLPPGIENVRVATAS
jgi:hypothetical protein